jgi:electron transfer flavoprotein alpha/beta subunit
MLTVGGTTTTFAASTADISSVTTQTSVVTIEATDDGSEPVITTSDTKTSKFSTKSPKIVSVKKLKASSRRITWKAVTGATKYKVKVCVNKSFAKKYKPTTVTTEDTQIDLIKMKKGKTYYLKVCAISKKDGSTVTGTWSKVKAIKR